MQCKFSSGNPRVPDGESTRTFLIEPVPPLDATLNRLQINPDKTWRREEVVEEIGSVWESGVDGSDCGWQRVCAPLPERKGRAGAPVELLTLPTFLRANKS